MLESVLRNVVVMQTVPVERVVIHKGVLVNVVSWGIVVLVRWMRQSVQWNVRVVGIVQEERVAGHRGTSVDVQSGFVALAPLGFAALVPLELITDVVDVVEDAAGGGESSPDAAFDEGGALGLEAFVVDGPLAVDDPLGAVRDQGQSVFL